MKITNEMLVKDDQGRIKPVALIGREGRYSIFESLRTETRLARADFQLIGREDILFTKEDHFKLIAKQEDELNARSAIDKFADTAISFLMINRSKDENLAIRKGFPPNDQGVITKTMMHHLTPFLAQNIGDGDGILMLTSVETAAPEAQDAIMKIVTGNHPECKLGSNVVVAFQIDQLGSFIDPSGSHFKALVEENCTVFDLSPTVRKKPTGLSGELDPVIAGASPFADYIRDANLLCKYLAAPKLFDHVYGQADKFALEEASDRLTRLVATLYEMEGGLYGVDAISRGVDDNLVDALRRIPPTELLGNSGEEVSALAAKINELVYEKVPTEPAFVQRKKPEQIQDPEIGL